MAPIGIWIDYFEHCRIHNEKPCGKGVMVFHQMSVRFDEILRAVVVKGKAC